MNMNEEKSKKSIMDYETVELDDENDALVILDPTKQPGRKTIMSA